MVAKTPTKERRAALSSGSLNPNLVRETLNKVERCMERLQELQCTVTGGTKVVGGVSLSPRSTRGYLRTSLRCKQESIRMKNAASRKSPPGKFPAGGTPGEWRRMSLPAMLLGETVAEILEANDFAKQTLVSKLIAKPPPPDPKTPKTARKNSQKTKPESTDELKLRRTKEKQQRARRKFESPAASRARSRINFKQNSPPIKPSTAAYRVSPRNQPWKKKTVLFPNPAFQPSSSSSNSPPRQQQRFYKTRSPVILKARPQPTPHKFLIKSPNAPPSLRSQFKSKKAVPAVMATNSSPPVKVKSVKPRRCSFSPSRLANRLMSPLKSRIISSPLKLRASIQRSSNFY